MAAGDAGSDLHGDVELWVEINPQTAGRLGIGDGDVVEIASAHGTVRAPALISPGIAPDVLAMPVGQGHETFTRYASGRGSNPVKVLGPSVEQDTGALAWAATRVKLTRVGDPDGDADPVCRLAHRGRAHAPLSHE